MTGYKELSEKTVFTFEDAKEIYKNESTTYSALRRLVMKGLLKKIRNNLYSCVNASTGDVYADKFQIASNINKSSYISHYSAFDFYGYSNQVYNTVYVSSSIHFNSFEFEGIYYQYVKSIGDFGVIEPSYTKGVRVTDIERTIIDAIYHIDKISSLDEILNNMDLVNQIKEQKILTYLEHYNNQGLYQKVAFILSLHRSRLNLSDDFFKILEKHIKKSVRYLNSESEYKGKYLSKFQLVVPRWVLIEKKEDE
ncbi:MAG: type IV toxin-antitoxin system AbiEi family antitoxin [Acholeplasmataceae bacterium]|nr:type IV toxin-antitoxin system AbiEi family antitoxin [Acholeplasmataceae bacterium]